MLWVDDESFTKLCEAAVIAGLNMRDAAGLRVAPNRRVQVEHVVLGMLTTLVGCPVVREGTVFAMPMSMRDMAENAPLYTWPPHPVPPKVKV